MQIDKIIKREVISLVISIILILLIFVGVSFASFFDMDEGGTNTISFGDIDLTFCNDPSCNEDYTNIGQTIGLTDVGGVSTPSNIYPYATNEEALATQPYIFNVSNTGSLKLNITAILEEDDTFVPTGNYSSFTQTGELYSSYIKIGISECSGGTINRTNVNIYRFGSLDSGKIINNSPLRVGENRTYCLWTWLAEDTPNAVQSTYFVANLSISGEYLPVSTAWYEKCDTNNTSFRCKILSDNTSYADNVTSTYVTSSSGINFGAISSDTNGKGLYYTTDTSKTEDINIDGYGDRVYYFRGAVTNNYAIFGGYCWKIIRTNEDGSVKLRYDGVPTDGGCAATGTSASITGGAFNQYSNDNTYAGYMTGTTSASSFYGSHSNTTNSNAKILLEGWYSGTDVSSSAVCTSCNFTTIVPLLSNINYTNKIVDYPFCNDRSIEYPGTISSTVFTNLGYGTENTLYGSSRRLATNGISGTTWSGNNAIPQYKCNNVLRDGFTLTSSFIGNKKISYPIGLLTADEAVYAGLSYNTSNTSNYLYTNDYYWTMSPFKSDDGTVMLFNITNTGSLMDASASYEDKYYPVVSVKATTSVVSGLGTSSSPYIVE